jgi:AcrR family transcriptional regulator
MDDIAAELGVSKGALYLYFRTKAELLRAIQSESRRDVFERMERIPPGSDLAEGFARILDEMISEETTSSAWAGILHEAGSDPEVRAALRADRRGDYLSLRRYLARVRARGELPRVVDLEATVTLVIAVLEGAAIQYMLGWPRPDVRRRLVRALRVALGT